MRIGIVGNGYVGKATALLKKEGVEVLIWDIDRKKRNIDSFEDLSKCDLIFVCVPTPMNEDGSCHTEIVEKVVHDLYSLVKIKGEDIIVRSTVPVGTCERLGVSFMPEFLTEARWREDFINNKNWIFGIDNSSSNALKILKLAELWNKEVSILATREAELIKYTRNTFLAMKVSFFNEIEQFCSKMGVSYENVSKGVALDCRIGSSHTQVPGPDGKRGYGGTCFPKDINSLFYQMSDAGVESYMIEASKARNEQVDRMEQDWKLDKGRAFIE